ncbi:MAG: hypothetical protein K5989_12425, partial [Lachnospiraceae bacterium]|nr:hypothetical protein [Lachnospiraceae bacterium]
MSEMFRRLKKITTSILAASLIVNSVPIPVAAGVLRRTAAATSQEAAAASSQESAEATSQESAAASSQESAAATSQEASDHQSALSKTAEKEPVESELTAVDPMGSEVLPGIKGTSAEVASVTIDDTTKQYDDFFDAVDAWKACDSGKSATLKLHGDTRPAVPPYSSTTIASWLPVLRSSVKRSS